MYTEDLIREVKELYPESQKMAELAESGNAFLGRYLDDSSYGIGIGMDEILSATNLQTIQDKVRLHKRKRELYSRWCNQDPRNK